METSKYVNVNDKVETKFFLFHKKKEFWESLVYDQKTQK